MRILLKNSGFSYYVFPLLIIIVLSFITGIFKINDKTINSAHLWDMAGRPYKEFLNDLNLPQKVGALLVSGTPENVGKIEEFYKKVEPGNKLIPQLLSLLFGIKITPHIIAFYINLVFGLSAILFALLVGYKVLGNGYASIVLFLLLALFRNSCQGLLYGLPNKYSHPVMNPLIVFVIIIAIILFLRNSGKKYAPIFLLSGFIIALINCIRTSEFQIIIATLFVFIILIIINGIRGNFERYRRRIVLLLTYMIIGYFGFQMMMVGIETHRDKKFNFPPNEEDILSAHTFSHIHFISMFRYPNKQNYCFQDMTGIKAVYKKHPELKEKYSTDYFALQNSKEYNDAIKIIHRDYILNNPGPVLAYFFRSIYDYFLFLPYYSWSGDKSAHAYIPRVNENVEIDEEDLAPDFKLSNKNWILNLKLKYFPANPLFWIYFLSSYLLLIQSIYEVLFRRREVDKGISIIVLQGMLIYFFFASSIRILIPDFGHSSVVAFNVLIIYNLVRLSILQGNVAIRKIRLPVWLWLFFVLLPIGISSGIAESKGHKLSWKVEDNVMSIVKNKSKRYLQLKSSGNVIGFTHLGVPTQVGTEYKLTANFKKGGAADGQIKVGTFINATDLFYSGVLSDSAWKQYTAIFKASTVVTYITLVNLTSIKNQIIFFDDVVLENLDTGKIIYSWF
ncbi:MAG: hypothetical protein D8M57_00155 [Candidatus Scalindua sp. AMX11]|nr:MAG: hypothetical protein DWQ00_18830 [Candidatus Scalindua sp.]NOG84119.1 hypothetical protein [Planctomycetota bacterium]RZV98971.1 MAG: hypothetical protein EX341_00750 [Candidatus Scalindua sp. SCAELEC01]TDE66837.1 MAG: hypothetical protein D8M57_00155 [Candidatus Scalindua sp. AMX11]GJQ57636.1 MAG: hypothetical protein SCALA701_04370 [Candidatus Scalindua sp.]